MTKRILAAAAILCGMSAGFARAASDDLPWPAAQKIVDSIKQPSIPSKTFQVSDFGIRGDGGADNTAAFAKAFDAIAAAGGGHLIVPGGRYLTGAIHLKSHVDLHLDAGAIIEFSSNVRDFPIEPTRYQGIDLMNTSPLIGAIGQTDISITGPGILDASATKAWNKDGKGNWKILVNMGAKGVPIKDRLFGPQRPLRTTCLEVNDCSNVLIQGITIRGSHFWQMHPLLSTNVTIDGVTTESRGGQTDGCDPESCSNVLIENCTLGSDDDCIAIKSGRDPDSQRVHKPTQNIVIMNCRFHGPWGMITCGSEQTEGIEHVFAYNLSTINDIPDILHWTGIGSALFFKTNNKRGGFIRDIHLDKITGKFNRAILWGFLNYAGNGRETGTNYPDVRDIYLSHITDVAAPKGVVDLTGLYNDMIHNVQISDCTFTNVGKENIAKYVEGLVFQNTTINGQEAK